MSRSYSRTAGKNIPCCDAVTGCQVGKKRTPPPFIPTSAGGFIGPLKRINHFPLPGLRASHPLLSTLSFVTRAYMGKAGGVGREGWTGGGLGCTCVAFISFNVRAPAPCRHAALAAVTFLCRVARMCLVGQLAVAGAFHVHYHLFYSGIFKSEGPWHGGGYS